MKYFLVCLLIFPISVLAQDCSLRDVKDQLNQDTRLTTGFKSLGVGSNKFMLSIAADKLEVDFFIALDNSTTCFNDASRAIITFEGGRFKTNYRNGGTTNCKGYFHLVFRNQEALPSNLKNLAEKKVVSIQFIDNLNEKKDVVLRPEDQALFQSMVACVLAELEDLRKDTWKPAK